MVAVVKLQDLLDALDYVSADGSFEHGAYVSREDGRVHWMMDEGALDGEEDEFPQDIEDEEKYVPVPHKRDLDLGRRLALRFVHEHLPDEADRVSRYFSRSGAYSRFKERLEDLGQLQAWYTYEQAAIVRAVLEWAAEEGLEVSKDASAEG